jgi:glycosyltransferase involved in cell wall biosynthesis
LNILILCHKTPYPSTDGGTIASLNLITGLSNIGNNVDVLMMQTPKHNGDASKYPDELTEQINWHQVFVNTHLSPVKALKNLLFSKLPYNAERFIDKNFNSALTNLLNSNRYDIIQLEGLYLTPYIKTIRTYSKAKISLRAHNVECEIWERLGKQESNPLKKWYTNLLAKRISKMEIQAINQCDLLVAITKRDEKVLTAFGNKNSISIPSGFDENKISTSTTNTNNTFFHIGALDWTPNQEGLLWFFTEVWNKNKELFPNWSFVLAGRNAPGHFTSKLSEFAIDYRGEVPNAHSFIDQHNVMIVPLLSGSGMRIKIVEGMARGKCIITTNIGAEGIDVINGEHLLIANTPEEFTKAMKNISESPQTALEIGNNARNFVREQLSNAKLSAKLADFYETALSNH